MSQSSMLTRRPFLLQPGQSLLLAPDAFRTALDFGVFADFAGLLPDHLIGSRMAPVPIPVDSGRPADGSRPRVEGVRPEAMWMPLLWLPPRLANRYTFQIIDGAVSVRTQRTGVCPGYPVYVETDDLWVLRIALELSASGLYDEVSGTWLDVMAMLDLNVDDPHDLARIAAWLDGGKDQELDLLDSGLEIGSMVENPENPQWALNAALMLHDELLESSWALGADSLLGVTDDLKLDVDEPGVMPESKFRFVLQMICLMGGHWLSGASVPDEPVNEEAWWEDVSRRLERGGDPRVILEDLGDHLLIVRNYYWERMDRAAKVHLDVLAQT